MKAKLTVLFRGRAEEEHFSITDLTAKAFEPILINPSKYYSLDFADVYGNRVMIIMSEVQAFTITPCG